MSKKQIEFNITPEETIPLKGLKFDHAEMGVDVYNAYMRNGTTKHEVAALGAVFRAGIIEGKRQERAKRRR